MKCLVCGMDINERNLDFNNFAFLKKNNKDNILYCPFCGASITYLGNGGEVINTENKYLDERTLRILDHAVKLELFNGNFYKTASIMAKSPEVKKMFECLSRIEITHSKIHQRLGGFKETPVLNSVSYSRYDSDKALLNLAKQKEEHAVSFYNRYRNEISDRNIIRIFDALTEVEIEHIALTDCL